MMKWIRISDARYREMLEILPPACRLTHGFLLGEARDHDSPDGRPRYTAFISIGGKFYEGDFPLTVARFKSYSQQHLAKALEAQELLDYGNDSDRPCNGHHRQVLCLTLAGGEKLYIMPGQIVAVHELAEGIYATNAKSLIVLSSGTEFCVREDAVTVVKHGAEKE